MGKKNSKQVQVNRLSNAMFGIRKRIRNRSNPPLDSKDRVINLIRFVIFFQLAIVGATIFGCFMPGKVCDSDVKQHIANMMTVITTSTFALYAAEK
tara:strand:+ start:400 stop:687 length:288 start_codon:yes stop_codon:yes gene_type:complete